MMDIINWLNKPYPFIDKILNKLLISGLFGLFVFIFLSLFQPFGITEIVDNKSVYLLGFGFVTSLAMIISYILLPLLLPKLFDSNYWCIKKELIFILSNIFFITILNYEYYVIFDYDLTTEHSLIFFGLITASVGIFPVTFMVFIREMYLTSKSKKNALELSSLIEQKVKKVPENETITINTDTKADMLKLNLQDLLYIKSEDNYCKLYFKENNQVQNKLLRILLKNIEDQLKDYPEILRCHRSYIVNKNHILKISGNARSYVIHFALCKDTAFVSRNFPKEMLI
ncbi:MAG: LytTR family transcriptional regulator [Bacteroidales bacterium]|nr:LytTR family transcriptional regulator [Bacteroidales bacterium]